MQKNSFLQSNPPIVEFSKLDENNKAEFLQFLIKNNITFDNASGKDNVIAKVTLKTLKPLKNPNKLTQSHNNQNKKLTQKYDPKNKKVTYADKENNENYHQQNNKKITSETSKSPLKNKTFTTLSTSKANNKNATSPSPFKQINLEQKVQVQNTKSKKAPKINESTVSIKSQRNGNKQHKQTVTTDYQLKQKTPERKLYGQMPISPAKSTQKLQQKSVNYRESNNTPIKSEKSVSYKKESHEQLSNFKKSQNLDMKSASTYLQTTTKHTKTKLSKQKVKDKSIQKVRDKVSVKEINSSRENLITKERTLSMCSSNEQTLSFNRNQSFEAQERIQLVNKYKEYFSNFTSLNGGKSSQPSIIKQRPVCWPLTQVEKFLDEFYDENFAKNTNQILNGSKKFNDSLSKGQLKTSHIVESLEKYFNRKFNKVHKAIEYNLINLLYSIAFYINEYQQLSKQKQRENCSFISLKMFESFLTQKYELQDYLFFLFCRNILKQDFKKCFMPTVSKSMINKKQIDKFLKQIVGQNNTQILQEYHHMIFKMIPTYDIEVNTFMKLIVKDYMIKREAAEKSHREKINRMQNMYEGEIHEDEIEHDEDSSLENTFNKILNIGQRSGERLFDNEGHIIREDSMEELTFGEETKEILREVQMHSNNQLNDQFSGPNYPFWQSPYISKHNQHIEKERFLNDQFNQMVTEKLCQKTVELIEILSLNGTTKFITQKNKSTENPCLQNSFHKNHNEQDEQSEEEETEIQQVEQLLFSKALCMFFTVVEMNKVKWLKELHITNPTQEDIQKVEEIQLFFRKIKEFPTAKDIAEFCKLILTVSQITEELSKFFV